MKGKIRVRYNVALEEYVYTNLDKEFEYLILWRNSPTVIIGKYQNIYEEVNMKFTDKYNIPILRRNSGGGAVYHDEGNLNFSLIKNISRLEKLDIESIYQPVINSLHSMGIEITSNKKHDLFLRGSKISGSSQYIKANRILHHGTLLVDSNIEMLKNALLQPEFNIYSKSTKSNRSGVTNISDHYNIDISQIEDTLIESIALNQNNQYIFSEEEIEEIKKIEREKYLTEDWNYAMNPKCKIEKDIIFENKKIHLEIEIVKGKISELKSLSKYF